MNDSTTTINLTDKQARFAEHAVEGLVDHFGSLLATHEIAEMPPMPIVEGSILTLPTHEDVITDLLYRLEEQAPDMCRGETGVSAQPSLTLASKIRKVTGYGGPTF